MNNCSCGVTDSPKKISAKAKALGSKVKGTATASSSPYFRIKRDMRRAKVGTSSI